MPTDPQSRARIAILLLVCALYSVALAWLLSRQTQVLNRSDFLPRWYAAHKYVAEGRRIYDPQNSLEVFSLNHPPSELKDEPTIYPAHFFYPAHLMLLILPFTLLPFPTAFFVWLTLTQLFLVAAIYWIARAEGWPHTPNQLAVYLMLALFFIPSIQNTIWGQFNTLSAISLALVYLCLRRERYAWAGVFALGLTFKPQAMLLTLAFLLVWSLARRRRWAFALSFGLSGLAAWAFAEWIEPNWVSGFVEAVRAYSAIHHPQGVLSSLGPLGSALNAVLILLAAGVFVWNRNAAPESAAFAGTLLLSLSVWWLTVAVLGMMNLAALPMALIWLFAHLEKARPVLYRLAVYFYPILYVLGLAGFVYGLTRPEWYGLHTVLSELAYKTVAPMAMALLALPLCFAGRPLPIPQFFQRKEAL
jgi:hypothetical protein